MPLPRAAEDAAARIGAVGQTIDDLVLEHMVNGRPLPTLAEFRTRILPDVHTAVQAAILEADPNISAEDLDFAVAEAVDTLTAVFRRARRDAQSRRQRIIRTRTEIPPDEDVTLITFPRLAKLFGFAAAFAAVIDRVRGPIPRERVQQAAARSGTPLPPRLEAMLRAAIRTKAAELRNDRAATVAEREGWAIWVRDAMGGPSDPPCERVDSRWATPEWMRRHLTEHPSCTRQGTPMPLPPGARITLIR